MFSRVPRSRFLAAATVGGAAAAASLGHSAIGSSAQIGRASLELRGNRNLAHSSGITLGDHQDNEVDRVSAFVHGLRAHVQQCLMSRASSMHDVMLAKQRALADRRQQAEEHLMGRAPWMNALIQRMQTAPAEERLDQVATCHVLLDYSSETSSVSFKERSGPRNMGLLVVRLKACVFSDETFMELADLCRDASHKGMFSKAFVTVFDTSEMIIPTSPLMWRRLMGLLQDHQDDLSKYMENQQGFAVIRGNSYLFNAVVDVALRILRCDTLPHFAEDIPSAAARLKEVMEVEMASHLDGRLMEAVPLAA